MAGGNSFVKNPQKGKYNPAFDGAEVYKAPTNHQVTVSSILNGVLRPGETIDFSQEIKTPEKPIFDQHIEREQAVFINDNKKEIAQDIENLRNQIKSLIPVTENLSQDISNISLQNTPENNIYQLNFFERAKNSILNFRKDTSDSNSWVEVSNNRKTKRNAFWNRAKSKNGGEKYLNSSEHAVARSAN